MPPLQVALRQVRVRRNNGEINQSAKKTETCQKPVQITAKNRFDVKAFAEALNHLDQNNYGSWPVPVKVTVLLFMVAVIAFLTWFYRLVPNEEIAAAEAGSKPCSINIAKKNPKHVI